MSELSGKDRAAESEKELTAVPAKKRALQDLGPPLFTVSKG